MDSLCAATGLGPGCYCVSGAAAASEGLREPHASWYLLLLLLMGAKRAPLMMSLSERLPLADYAPNFTHIPANVP